MTTLATRRHVLVDRFGRPFAGNLYPSPSKAPHRYRPRQLLQRDTRANYNAYDRRKAVEDSRQLFTRLSNLGSAIIDKNTWAFGDGWLPTYTGANVAWGDKATAFLREQFLPNCDRHGRWDWCTCLYLSGVAWDRDGDDAMILTEDNNGSGFPKVEFIPATRIANGNDSEDNKVHGGRWDGFRIFDGIVFDDTDSPVAIRILGESPDGDPSAPKYQDYALGPGGNVDLAYQPEWVDQGRGIPLIGRPSLDWCDLEDIDEFLKRGIKRASSVGLVEKNKEGEAGFGNAVTVEETQVASDGTSHAITYEEIEGGEVYYLRANEGEEIAGLNYSTPHPNVENFISRIERRGIKAVGWSYELIYLAESGRAATRLVCDLGNQSIWKQQKLGLRRTWRAVRYALAKAMKYGFLARNPDPRDAYFAWDFGLPKQLSVDAGNDEQADRENLKIGSTNLAIVTGKKGEHWRDVKRQRRIEIIANAEEAQAIADATGGKVPFDKAFELLEQRAANPTAQAPPAPDQPPADQGGTNQ